MMNCATCERNLSAYIDDELAGEMRLEMEGHLDECERCRGELESHQATWEATHQAQAGRAPEGMWEGIAAELGQETEASTSLDDLALMIRGLAGEVQDLRREVTTLRRELAVTEWAEEQESEEDIRLRGRRFTARPREASIEQLRRTS